MKKTIWTCFALTLLFLAVNVNAHQPCAGTSKLEQTISKADFVILGQEIGELKGDGLFSPKAIKVRVVQNLKGNTEKNEILIRTMYGMCPYGINLPDNKTYMIFLTKLDPMADEFNSVRFGCSVGYLLTEDENVLLRNGEEMSFTDFKNKYNLSDWEISETGTMNENNFAFVGIGIFVIIALAVLALKMWKK